MVSGLVRCLQETLGLVKLLWSINMGETCAGGPNQWPDGPQDCSQGIQS